MKVIKFPFIAIFAMLLLVSCSDDDMGDNTPMGQYENGVFIINEGPFTGGSGTVDFYNKSTSELIRNVYQLENSSVLGNVLQSMNVIDDKAYLVANNSGRITVVGIDSFDFRGTINDLRLPRYTHETGPDHILVTEWGLDGLSGQIARVEKSSLTVLNRVPWNGPEKVITSGDRTYILDNGGFGEGNEVSVLNADLEKVGSISVGEKPNSILEDKNGDLWVLSGGSFTTLGGASLVRISNEVVSKTIDLPFGASNLVIDGDLDQLYFYSLGELMTMSIEAELPSLFYNIPEGSTPYGLGYDMSTDELWLGTTPDFSSESSTYIVSQNGSLVQTLTTGILTNSFVFR